VIGGEEDAHGLSGGGVETLLICAREAGDATFAEIRSLRAFSTRRARPSLVHLGILALAALILVAFAAEAPLAGRDQPPPPPVVAL